MTTNPEIVNELRRLAKAHGGILHPKAIVEAARAEDSPLHSAFEWDDTEAAERYREYQARQLARVVVTYQRLGDRDVPVRVLVNLTSDRDAGGYRLVSAVMADDEQRRQLIADALADMKRFRAKYASIVELAKVFEALDQVGPLLVDQDHAEAGMAG